MSNAPCAMYWRTDPPNALPASFADRRADRLSPSILKRTATSAMLSP